MKNISNDLKDKCGIYCIINIQNHKRYIGSTKNLQQRLWKHRSLLRHNKHENAKLQNSWNKHGEENFDYYILEFCNSVDVLCEREQFFIDTLHPEYNFTTLVERNILSAESRKKQSMTRKRLFAEGKLMPNHCHEVFQYNLNGEYITSFYSIYEACRITKLHPSTIIRCLQGTYRRGGNYLWSYTKELSLPPYKYIKRGESPFNKPVCVTNLITGEKLYFKSIKETMNQLHLSRWTVQTHLKEGTPFKNLYKFNFELPSK